jgi:hypothetical protein
MKETQLMSYGNREQRLKVWTTEEILAKRGNGHKYVYVDHGDAICRQTSGYYSQACVEYEDEDNWITYRCLYCHRDEINKFCDATTISGRHCFNYKQYGDFCSQHSRQRVGRQPIYSVEQLDEWLDAWQKETVLQWKLDVLKKLEAMGDITVQTMRAMLEQPQNSYVYFIECEGYVKVGKSVDPNSRFKTLTGSGGGGTIFPNGINLKKAKLIGYVPGTEKLERHFHFLLREHRGKGEWFRLDSKVAKFIERTLGKGEGTMRGTLEDLSKNIDVVKELSLKDHKDMVLDSVWSVTQDLKNLREEESLKQ